MYRFVFYYSVLIKKKLLVSRINGSRFTSNHQIKAGIDRRALSKFYISNMLWIKIHPQCQCNDKHNKLNNTQNNIFDVQLGSASRFKTK